MVRLASITCAMMASAISSGDTAPIASPAGPLMRSMACVSNPASCRRRRRLACVRELPSAPM